MKADCMDTEEFEGHLIVTLPEGRFLVDTGSPTSFARGRCVSFGGATTDVADNAMGMLDSDALSGYVGIRLDGLLGMDVLGQHRLTFDRGRIFVGDGEVCYDFGKIISDSSFFALETGDFMGIPVVAMNVNKRPVRMFVDTGAKISYLNPAWLAEFPVEETADDFYPGVGKFDVDISSVWCDLNGWPFQAKFGRLPPLLQLTLGMGGVDGILGHDLFSSYTIRIEKGGRPVSFLPHI